LSIRHNGNTEEYKSITFSLGVEDINAHAQTVYTRPSPSPILEGLGTRLNLVWTPLHAWKCLAGIWMKLHCYTVDWDISCWKIFVLFSCG